MELNKLFRRLYFCINYNPKTNYMKSYIARLVSKRRASPHMVMANKKSLHAHIVIHIRSKWTGAHTTQ